MKSSAVRVQTAPRHFFWSGNGEPKSAVADWLRGFRRLFEVTELEAADGTVKRRFPHMFRDTYAFENLLAGAPIDQVSILLGHKSVKITEKHYAPFMKARQEQLTASVRKAWEGISPKQKGLSLAMQQQIFIPHSQLARRGVPVICRHMVHHGASRCHDGLQRACCGQ